MIPSQLVQQSLSHTIVKSVEVPGVLRLELDNFIEVLAVQGLPNVVTIENDLVFKAVLSVFHLVKDIIFDHFGGYKFFCRFEEGTQPTIQH